MTADEALKAIEGLQAVASIQLLALQPDDVIVIECRDILDDDQRKYLEHTVRYVIPNQRVLVVDAGMTLKAVRGVRET